MAPGAGVRECRGCCEQKKVVMPRPHAAAPLVALRISCQSGNPGGRRGPRCTDSAIGPSRITTRTNRPRAGALSIRSPSAAAAWQRVGLGRECFRC